jgi:superfamily II DNA or RNA helicase
MRHTLRPYQKKQAWDLVENLKEHDAVILQSPTGTGKGTIMAYIFSNVTKKGGQVMFVVYGRAVVSAFCDELEENGIDHTILMAGEDYNHNHDAIVASMDSLHSWYFKANARNSLDDLIIPKYLLVDECRKLVSPKSRKIFKWFQEQGTKIIGFDATPKAPNLHTIYTKLIHGKPTPWHIKEGNLVPIIHYSPAIQDQEYIEQLKNLRKRSNGDYSDKDMEDISKNHVLVGDLVSNYERISTIEYGDYRRFMVACINRKHARSVESAFLEKGHPVEYIDGETPKKERLEMFDRVRSGETMGLISVLVLIYGVNIKPVEIGILARPTADIRLLLQFGGRILRPIPGKEKAVFIDHTRATQELGFLDDEYFWPLEEEYSNVSRERKKADTKTEHADITCMSCGHVYESLSTCPKCGEQNVIRYDEPNVIYYNKELERRAKDADINRIQEKTQLQFLSELKKYLVFKGGPYYTQLNTFNNVARTKFGITFTPELFNEVPLSEGFSNKIVSYVKYVQIRRSYKR